MVLRPVQRPHPRAAFAGTSAGFRQFLADRVEAIGADYFACDIAFGDMTFDEAMQTTEIIGRKVIAGAEE
ncbi:MAG: hypothetical protein JXB36_07615 [Gammaproteobacteria bacterium]|nr:hypothetical protein [Gammaproteobacteria bacterium]